MKNRVKDKNPYATAYGFFYEILKKEEIV